MTTRQWHCRRNPAQQRVRRADALAAECVSMPQPQGQARCQLHAYNETLAETGSWDSRHPLRPARSLLRCPSSVSTSTPHTCTKCCPRHAPPGSPQLAPRGEQAARRAALRRCADQTSAPCAPHHPAAQTPILRTCMSRPMSPAHPNTIFGCGRDTTLPLGGGLALECG